MAERKGFAAIALCLALLIGDASADGAVSQQKIDALKSRIRETTEWIEKAERERNDLQRNLRKTERELDKVSRSLFQLEIQQQELEGELSVLARKERDLEARSADLKHSLSNQIRAVYAQGDSPALKLLLSGDNPTEFSRTLTYFRYLSDATVAEIIEFNDVRDTLALVKLKQVEQKEKIADAAEELASRQQELDRKRKDRNQALLALQGELKDRRGDLAQMQGDQKRLEKLLQEVERAVADIELPPSSTPFSKLKGKLPWPSKGKVVGSFGATMGDSALRRNGIIIRNEERSPVQAVHYGRVVFSDSLRGFGLLLIVDHGQGYMTLYGNNQSLLKETGDWVKAGENIALTGSGSAGEGAGLYFEIRHLGKPANPLTWLAKSRKR